MTIVLFDGFSQAADVNVDGAGRHKSLAAPDAIEELIAAEHPVGILNQKAQKLEFFERQFDIFSARENFVGSEINL